MSEYSVDLSELSEGELLELLVPSQSSNRRMIVMWLYLRDRPSISLPEFDRTVTSLAEKELKKRAGSGKADA